MLNPLQQKLLEMLTWLSKYIESNHLTYYVIGGTFLGAVRHKGFIPWDDDIDIAMPRKDYETLIKLLSKPVDHYVIESPDNCGKDFTYNLAKFYDLDTTMVEYARYKIKRGVAIDIFPLDGLGDTLNEAYKNYKRIDRINVIISMMSCKVRKSRKWWKNAAVMIGRLIPVNIHTLVKIVNERCKEKDFYSSKYVASCMSTYRSREIMERHYWGTPKSYQFENIEVKGPEMADEYLTHLFRNWRELPPVDKRQSAHDFIELDLNKSYLSD